MRLLAFVVFLFLALFGGAARADSSTVEVRLVDARGAEFPTRVGKPLKLGRALIPFEVASATVHDSEVLLTLTARSEKAFERLTAENVGRRLAIVIDGVVQQAPVIRDPIKSGKVSLTLKSNESARHLAQALSERH